MTKRNPLFSNTESQQPLLHGDSSSYVTMIHGLGAAATATPQSVVLSEANNVVEQPAVSIHTNEKSQHLRTSASSDRYEDKANVAKAQLHKKRNDTPALTLKQDKQVRRMLTDKIRNLFNLDGNVPPILKSG
jgi:hypothetical protein